MLPYTLLLLLPLLSSAQYVMGPTFGGCGGCPPPPCMAPRPVCAPPPIPFCPQPPPCPQQFCPPPPICPPPPPPMPCPPPPPPPSCGCSRPMPFYQQYPVYRPMAYQSYGGGCGGGASYAPAPAPIPAQNDCCCGCSSPCKYKSRRRVAAFGAKTVDPSCNNENLRDLIMQNIVEDASDSKRAIQKAAEDQLGYMVNVVCGQGEFSYIAHTESFCQTSKDGVTCYAFKPL